MSTVTIGVPTFRRPGGLPALVSEILRQADELEGEDTHTVEVVVVDNDPLGSARGAVEAISDARVRYAIEPAPGISAARNKIMDEAARSRVLLMIDDDERPEPGWLAAMLGTRRATGAAVVAGRVVAEYEGHLDEWLDAGRFFVRRDMPTGSPIEAAAAGNLLLDMEQVRMTGVRFDQRLGLTGGEDTLFTMELRRKGCRMVWCSESVIIDVVPAARMTPSWVLKRALSHGNSFVAVRLILADGTIERFRIRVAAVAGGVARIGIGAARWAFGVLARSVTHQARGARLGFRGAGLVAGAAGHSYQEYGREESAA